MVENIAADGKSVCLGVPIADRAATSVYRTVHHILRDTQVDAMLDVGASDGVANFDGIFGSNVVGLDIAASAAQANKTELSVQGDGLKLPFRRNVFSHILALDVVEHFPPEQALDLLAEMQRVGKQEHQLVVSMPLVDPTRLMTWIERVRMYKHGERPATGLFDRTHYILTGARQHRQLLQAAGYGVLAQYDTIAHTSGSAQVGGKNRVTDENPSYNRPRIVIEYMRRQHSRGLVYEALRHLLGYQRVYHLRSTR